MKTEKLRLPSGATGFTNDSGKWACTGSRMGRLTVLPPDPTAPVKLRLTRLPFVDGDYDRWGAYWGVGKEDVWLAYAGVKWFTEPQGFARALVRVMELETAVYLRADSREEAKAAVLEKLPAARFYR